MHRLSHCWIRSFSSSAQQVSTPARNGSVETIRTFVAIFPERSVSASIAKFTKRLHPHLERSNVRWTSLDNLHFTLCFLGNLESWQLARVEDIVEKTGIIIFWYRPAQVHASMLSHLSKDAYLMHLSCKLAQSECSQAGTNLAPYYALPFFLFPLLDAYQLHYLSHSVYSYTLKLFKDTTS